MRGQHDVAASADKIAYLCLCEAYNSVNWRNHLAKVQVQLGVVHGCLQGVNFGDVRFSKLRFVGVLLFGDHLLTEKLVASFPFSDGGKFDSFALLQLAFCLSQRGFGRPWVDFEKKGVFLNQRAFTVIALDQVTGYPCANLGVLRTVDGSDPFAINRNVAGGCRYHQNFRRSGNHRFLLTAATEADKSQARGKRAASGKRTSRSHRFAGCDKRNSSFVPGAKVSSPKLKLPRFARVVCAG